MMQQWRAALTRAHGARGNACETRVHATLCRTGVAMFWGCKGTHAIAPSRRLQQLGFDAESAAALEATLAEEQAAMATLKEQASELQGQLSALRFNYRDPEAGFDRSRVKVRLQWLTNINAAQMK